MEKRDFKRIIYNNTVTGKMKKTESYGSSILNNIISTILTKEYGVGTVPCHISKEADLLWE